MVTVDSPRKAYLKTLVRCPQIPRCPNGNMHCEDICMGASRGEDIGRYYYYASNMILGTANSIFTYISSSAKQGLEKSLASALQSIISQSTLNRDRTNSGSSLRTSTSGWQQTAYSNTRQNLHPHYLQMRQVLFLGHPLRLRYPRYRYYQRQRQMPRKWPKFTFILR